MRILSLLVFCYLPMFIGSSVYSAQKAMSLEELLYNVRPLYFVEHMLKNPDKKWILGTLLVQAGPNNYGAKIDYEFLSNQLKSKGSIRIKKNDSDLGNYEWKINPVYTRGTKHSVVGVENENSFACIYKPIQITQLDIKKILSMPTGYETLIENLNACVSDNHREALIGWLGIRSQTNISGVAN